MFKLVAQDILVQKAKEGQIIIVCFHHALSSSFKNTVMKHSSHRALWVMTSRHLFFELC